MAPPAKAKPSPSVGFLSGGRPNVSIIGEPKGMPERKLPAAFAEPYSSSMVNQVLSSPESLWNPFPYRSRAIDPERSRTIMRFAGTACTEICRIGSYFSAGAAARGPLAMSSGVSTAAPSLWYHFQVVIVSS
jgi:hypothetical protein